MNSLYIHLSNFKLFLSSPYIEIQFYYFLLEKFLISIHKSQEKFEIKEDQFHAYTSFHIIYFISHNFFQLYFSLIQEFLNSLLHKSLNRNTILCLFKFICTRVYSSHDFSKLYHFPLHSIHHILSTSKNSSVQIIKSRYNSIL